MKLRGRPKKPDVVTNLFIGDFQIPEQDDRAINAVLSFIPDLKPDYIHLMGDILDLTKQSSFDHNPYDKHTLNDELVIARGILKQIVDIGRKSNPECKVFMYAGNHEQRQLKALAKAQGFADVTVKDELVLSLPYLLELRELGITWVDYFKEHIIDGTVGVEHGDIARAKSGATASGMLSKRGHSGFSGHTHRLGLVYETYGLGITKFWVETGALCKKQWAFPYRRGNNWQQGFAIGTYIKEFRTMVPELVHVKDYSFFYKGKIYRG